MKSHSSSNYTMRMFFLWVIALIVSSPALGQSSDFAALQKHVNKQVTVETQDGPVTGKLLRVEENRLVVYQASGPQFIARDSVRKVTKHKSRHTAAWVLGGAAAGLGLGFTAGMYAFDDTRNANAKIAGFTAAEGGIGAAVGYGLSRIGKRDEVVYQQE